ncbi:Xaa-Pro aminopeptidase [Pseudoalteromonas sp. NBT06-2]|uniref:M24 family metallopeptidase n=1 Tax=Pseudoalteromonas sp. NBT06-2 TaxID=2025950 RepID=UPI000BA7A4FA|nr:Xaa-Pro peptidase family protein [Pseudoalteromonas sp. NBT06-2]PAJ76005.1 Xaa-Pro aminopeptidase [Pseudoalteromonas sp. NBT06-2]
MKEIYQQRQSQCRSQLVEQNLDALLVLGFENLRYLSGFSGHAAYGIITLEQNYLITDYRYAEQATKECCDFEIITRDREKETLGACIKRHLGSTKTLGFDAAFVNVAMWQDVCKAFSNIATLPITGMIERQRMVKDHWEIKQTKLAAAIADQALNELMPYFVAGATERDVALELEYRMQKLGSEGLAFDTIMLFSQRSSLPHGIPSEQKLKQGDFITLDFGAVINGYRSDMTRSYILGEASEKQTEVYNTVAQAQQAAINVLKPGLSVVEAYKVAREVLNESEYGQWAGDGLGHGLGLYLHEAPIIGPNCDYVLQPGNIITIEPGIYIPDFGGVRLEDDLLITDDGYQVLTHAPKPFLI